MDEEPVRSETDILLLFVEQTLPNLMNLLNLTDRLADVNMIRVKEIVAKTILEYGDLVPRRKPPAILRNIPKAMELALQGDEKGKEAIVLLVRTIIGGAFVFEMVTNLALAKEEKLTDGIKKLEDVFAGHLPKPARTEWYLALYSAMNYPLELGLLSEVFTHFEEMAKLPSYHCFHILESLLLNSAVARAVRSQPLDFESLYNFFVDKETRISREINEILEDMKHYKCQFFFVTTRAEPRVLFLSWLLRYCFLKRKFGLKPIVPGDPTSGYVVMIELTDELVREVKAWKSWQIIEQRLDWEFIEEKVRTLAKDKTPLTPHDRDYLDFKYAGPYVFFFSSFEGVGGVTSEKRLLVRPFQMETLTNVAVPFLSYIFPFVRVFTMGDRAFIAISGRTEREALMLFRALAYGSFLSATYAVQLLSGVYALGRLEPGKSKSKMNEFLKKLQTADYGPFLSPETMIRYALLFVDSMLFKFTNDLLKRVVEEGCVEYHVVIFEPTGNFEEDIRRLWEMAPLEARTYLEKLYGIKDVDDLLELVDREVYELFVHIVKVLAALLGICSAYLAKAYLAKRARR
jgi:hypothetical protein